MQIALSLLRYILLLVIATLLTVYILVYAFEPVYGLLLRSEVGGFGDIDFTDAAIIFVALQFYIPLFFIAMGDNLRYWAFEITLVLLSLIDYQVDPQRLLILLAIIVSGGLLGWLIRFVATNTLGKMPSFEPMKRYF